MTRITNSGVRRVLGNTARNCAALGVVIGSIALQSVCTPDH